MPILLQLMIHFLAAAGFLEVENLLLDLLELLKRKIRQFSQLLRRDTRRARLLFLSIFVAKRNSRALLKGRFDYI